MGHPRQVYCAHRFSELGEIGGVWGLDKNLAIALGAVQSGGCGGNWRKVSESSDSLGGKSESFRNRDYWV